MMYVCTPYSQWLNEHQFVFEVNFISCERDDATQVLLAARGAAMDSACRYLRVRTCNLLVLHSKCSFELGQINGRRYGCSAELKCTSKWNEKYHNFWMVTKNSFRPAFVRQKKTPDDPTIPIDQN